MFKSPAMCWAFFCSQKIGLPAGSLWGKVKNWGPAAYNIPENTHHACPQSPDCFNSLCVPGGCHGAKPDIATYSGCHAGIWSSAGFHA